MAKKKKNQKNNHNILIYLILIISLLLIYSYYVEPYILVVKEYKIENKKIPESFDGIKIVHFSDIHYGSKVDQKYLDKIVDLINKQNPDIVVFTGDFIDKRINLNNKEIKKINNSLNNITSTLGNYAINGNHDLKHIDDFKKIFDGTFTILNNEEKLIYYKDNTPISLVGLTDMSETKVDYSVLNDLQDYYRIILAHEPDQYNKIKKYDFDIQLSGHSHNGQIRIPLYGALYTPPGAKKYFDEYYKLDNKLIYISNGIGTSTIDMRFNSKPSINLYRLYSH